MNTFVNEGSNSVEFWNSVAGTTGDAQGILNALPRAEQALLRPKLEFFPLKAHQVLHQAGEVIKHAYFIENGLVSILNVQGDEKCVEVGTIGSGVLAGLSSAGQGGVDMGRRESIDLVGGGPGDDHYNCSSSRTP